MEGFSCLFYSLPLILINSLFGACRTQEAPDNEEEESSPIDRDVVASTDILWSVLAGRRSREKRGMDRWKLRTDSARENTIPLLCSGVQVVRGKEEIRESFLEEVEFKDEHDFGKGRDVPGILTEDRKGKGQVVGIFAARTGSREVPDSGT